MINNRAIKLLISSIARLIFFKLHINHSFNAHFICYIFQLVCVRRPSAVVSPSTDE